jgi:hypothetical protein
MKQPFAESTPCPYTHGMNVELTPDAALWVQAEVAAGRFATPEDALRFAVSHAKTSTLREELAAAEREGGRFTTADVRIFARDHLDTLPTGR